MTEKPDRLSSILFHHNAYKTQEEIISVCRRAKNSLSSAKRKGEKIMRATKLSIAVSLHS